MIDLASDGGIEILVRFEQALKTAIDDRILGVVNCLLQNDMSRRRFRFEFDIIGSPLTNRCFKNGEHEKDDEVVEIILNQINQLLNLIRLNMAEILIFVQGFVKCLPFRLRSLVAFAHSLHQ